MDAVEEVLDCLTNAWGVQHVTVLIYNVAEIFRRSFSTIFSRHGRDSLRENQQEIRRRKQEGTYQIYFRPYLEVVQVVSHSFRTCSRGRNVRGSLIRVSRCVAARSFHTICTGGTLKSGTSFVAAASFHSGPLGRSEVGWAKDSFG